MGRSVLYLIYSIFLYIHYTKKVVERYSVENRKVPFETATQDPQKFLWVRKKLTFFHYSPKVPGLLTKVLIKNEEK